MYSHRRMITSFCHLWNEIGVIWENIKYHKSAATHQEHRLILKTCTMDPCGTRGYATASRQSCKYEKNCSSTHVLMLANRVESQNCNFFKPSTLTAGSFAALWAKRIHSISSESPHWYLLANFLVKSVVALVSENNETSYCV